LYTVVLGVHAAQFRPHLAFSSPLGIWLNCNRQLQIVKYQFAQLELFQQTIRFISPFWSLLLLNRNYRCKLIEKTSLMWGNDATAEKQLSTVCQWNCNVFNSFWKQQCHTCLSWCVVVKSSRLLGQHSKNHIGQLKLCRYLGDGVWELF